MEKEISPIKLICECRVANYVPDKDRWQLSMEKATEYVIMKYDYRHKQWRKSATAAYVQYDKNCILYGKNHNHNKLIAIDGKKVVEGPENLNDFIALKGAFLYEIKQVWYFKSWYADEVICFSKDVAFYSTSGRLWIQQKSKVDRNVYALSYYDFARRKIYNLCDRCTKVEVFDNKCIFGLHGEYYALVAEKYDPEYWGRRYHGICCVKYEDKQFVLNGVYFHCKAQKLEKVDIYSLNGEYKALLLDRDLISIGRFFCSAEIVLKSFFVIEKNDGKAEGNTVTFYVRRNSNYVKLFSDRIENLHVIGCTYHYRSLTENCDVELNSEGLRIVQNNKKVTWKDVIKNFWHRG